MRSPLDCLLPVGAVEPSVAATGSLLALQAKERGAAVLGDAAHDAAAAAVRAAATRAIVDAKLVLKAPEFAVGAAVIAQRRAAGGDRSLEHLLDGGDEAHRVRRRHTGARRQGRGFAPRRQPRAVERLADIDVAEAGHDLLVEQRGFEARRLAGAGSRQP